MRFFPILLSAMVLGTTLLVWPGLADNVQSPRLLWWSICLVLMALAGLWSRDWKLPASLLSPIGAWSFYTVWSALTLVLSDHPLEGVFDLSRSILFLFTLIALTGLLGQHFRLRRLIGALVTISTSIILLAVLFQYLLLPVSEDPSDYFLRLYQITGFSGHKTIMSAFLVLGTPFIFYTSLRSRGMTRVLAWLVLSASAVTILYLQSRAAWIGLFIVLLLLLAIFLRHQKDSRRRRLFVIPLAAILILFASGIIWLSTQDNRARVLSFQTDRLFRLDDQQGRSRLSIWEATADLCLDHPITGVGPGQWRIAIPPYQTAYEMNLFRQGDRTGFQTWHRPHQDLLWVGAEKGLPGLIAYIAFWSLLFFEALKRIWLPRHRDGLLPAFAGVSILVYPIFAMVSFPSERFDIQILVLLSAAILGSKFKRRHTKKTTSNTLAWAVTWGALVSGLLILPYAVDVVRVQYIHGRYLALEPEQRLVKTVRRNWEEAMSSPSAGVDPFGIPYAFYPAMACYREKSWQCSRDYLDQAIGRHPNNLRILTASALWYYQQKDFPGALRDADRALAIFPEYEDALVVKTRTLQAMEQTIDKKE